MATEVAQSIVKIPLFKAFGIELEYIIVDRDTLDVMPITDKLLHAVSGSYVSEVNRGDITWSNELALHVLELKTTHPANSLAGLQHLFQAHVQHLNKLLKLFNAMLMPTGMHPWMNPKKEMRLWPHDSNPIYEAFNRIFDCSGHGWANLQSSHINLSFANDKEFANLHSAIRVLLPIMPAIAASSPIVEGRSTHMLDNRLQSYMNNAKKIPSITGKVIPEFAFSQKDYEERILHKMYEDIAAFDPKKILQHEWLNSRGAIPRFERFTIEIRLLDIQECALADIAIAQAIVGVLKALNEEKWCPLLTLHQFELEPLVQIFHACMKDGEMALITNGHFLSLFGFKDDKIVRAGELWQKIVQETLFDALSDTDPVRKALDVILTQGTLASRILKAWEKNPSPEYLKHIYKQLCLCLEWGRLFIDE